MSESEEGSHSPALTEWIRTTVSPYLVHAAASLSCVLVWVWTLKWHGSLSLKSPDLFNFHPAFMSVAFILIVPESILLMRFSGFRRQVSKPFHAALHLAGLVLAILGVAAVYKYHADEKFAHARSLHSWLGIATLATFVLQWLFGAFLFYRASGAIRIKFKPFHIHTGLTVVFLSSLSLVTGILERTVFAATCSSGVSTECWVANGSALLAVISFIAFATAITATTSPRYSRASLNEGLLAGGNSADDATVQIDA